jgi:hypothetical protein
MFHYLKCINMSAIYKDPCATLFNGVSPADEDCDVLTGKVVGVGVVHKSVTYFKDTGTGDIKLKASWVAAQGASTDALKALVLGEISFPEWTAGQPTKVDSGKANGIQRLSRASASGLKFRVDFKSDAYYKEVKKLTDLSTNFSQGTKIGVVFFYENGHVQYVTTGVKGIPIYNFFISDPVGGEESMTRDIMFDLPYGWADNTTTVKATDFLLIDLL